MSQPYREFKTTGVLARVVALVGTLLTLVAPLAILEGLSRLAHLGARPAIPYILDDDLNSRMAPYFSSKVKLSGHPVVEYCTDGLGLRRQTCGLDGGGNAQTVLGVGDSQVLGWGLAFNDTYTSRAVRAAYGSSFDQNVQLLAVAASDPESLRSWARDYARHSEPTVRLKILTLNLGNDFDEMYFRGVSVKFPHFRRVSEWLGRTSFFVMDFTLFKNLFGAAWQFPPGANPVVFSLDSSERHELAMATVDSLVRLDNTLPAAKHTVIVMLPQDYQVDSDQFKKYRSFYHSDAEYLPWFKSSREAVARLDSLDDTIIQELTSRGYIIVDPRAQLRAAPHDHMFDGASHHYTNVGQTIIGQQIAEKIEGLQ